ncbi:MAG: hypothetical protein ACR2N3_06980 [Pyrinomonadaceae bacterium]
MPAAASNNMRKINFTILLIAVSSFNLFAQSKVTKEKYAVYDAVLNQVGKEQLKSRKENSDKITVVEFVILNQTKTFERETEQNTSKEEIKIDLKLQRTINYFASAVRKSRTEKDFDLKNLKSSNLENLFPVNYKYNLTTKEEIDKLLQIGAKEFEDSQKKRKAPLIRYGSEDWNHFYKKYPNADGYYQFSRVGFNSNKTFAQVYLEGIGGEWNSNATYILKKVKGRWKIYSEFGGYGIS